MSATMKLHPHVVRQMDRWEREQLTGMRDMMDEGIRDLRSRIRSDIQRYKRLKGKRNELQKQLEGH